MVTMHDAAKKAGVFISTVFYAINGTRPISEKTNTLIRKAMNDLGYTPGALACGLAAKRSRIIALLCPAIYRRDEPSPFIADNAILPAVSDARLPALFRIDSFPPPTYRPVRHERSGDCRFYPICFRKKDNRAGPGVAGFHHYHRTNIGIIHAPYHLLGL